MRLKILVMLLVACHLPLAPVQAQSLTAKGETKKQSAWRGSGMVYRNVATAYSAVKDAELTYNPYYAMYLGGSVRYWLSRFIAIGADIGVTRELTQADDTTQSGEYLFDDLELSLSAPKFYTIPVLDVPLAAALTLVTPTSKLSRARSLNLGLRLGVGASRTFKLLKGLTIAYGLSGTKFFNNYTTAARQAPLVPGCNSADGFCDVFLNTGDRNPSWRLSHLLDLSLDITKWIGLSGRAGIVIDYLYDVSTDERVSYVPSENTDRRYAMVYGAELYTRPMPSLGVSLGFSTVNPQLKANSTYEQPFVNRYTAIYLDLILDIEGLVAQLSGEDKK